MPTMTIDTTAEHAQRVAAAFGRAMGLTDANGNPRAATGAEVKQHVVRYIKNVVFAQEAEAAAEAARQAVTEVAPT